MQHRDHAFLEQQAALEAVNAIRAKYGNRAIGALRSQAVTTTLQTGLAELDALTEGLPQGQLVELVGHGTSGMQTLMLSVIANVQQRGLTVAYVDFGRTLDAAFAVGCGVDVAELVRICPTTVQQAFEIAYTLLQRAAVDLLVMDCWPFLYKGQSQIETALPQLIRPLARGKTAFVLQSHPHFAHTALSDYAALRLHVQRQGWLVRYGDTVGYRVGVSVLKSRFGRIGQHTSLDLTFNQQDDSYL